MVLKQNVMVMIAMGGVVLTGLSSCQSLELEGPPPSGEIVPATVPLKVYTPAAALNYMSTSLCAGCMGKFRPGTAVACQYDFQSGIAVFASYPHKALNGIRDLIAFRQVQSSAVVLRSRIVAGAEKGHYEWGMKLSENGKQVWSDRVIIVYQP